MPELRVVRDPIYGYVRVPNNFVPVVDHPLVQRLRRVSQTSMTSSVCPSATGMRFEHALGTMHLAREAWAAIVENTDVKTMAELRKRMIAEVEEFRPNVTLSNDPDDFVQVVDDGLAAASLLHDLGHPPFSHVLEPFFATLVHGWLSEEQKEEWGRIWPGQFHEAAGTLLAATVLEHLNPHAAAVAEWILRVDPDEHHRAGAVLHSVLASEIDIDRIDYLMRDAQRAGTEFGAVDYVRLIQALEIRRYDMKFRVAPSARARSAVETLLVQRTQSYKWIIYHHRVVGTNEALARAVQLAWDLRSEASEVEVFADRHVVGELFETHVPTLNYIRPVLRDVRRRTAIATDHADTDRERDVLQRLSMQMQAGVDDSTIVEWLKGASATAALLRNQTTRLEPRVKDRLNELITFTDVALSRRQCMVSVWKTIEDFQVVANDLVNEHSVGRMLVEICNEELPDARRAGEQRVRGYRDRLDHALVGEGGDRMRGINVLAQIFLSERSWRHALDTQLQAEHGTVLGRRGFWATGYTGFRAIRTQGQLASLWHMTQREPAAMRETSPLVAALDAAEEARPRLYAYFLLVEGDDPPALMEEQLRRAFNETFARFLAVQWRAFIKGIAIADDD
ncbi:HD domain-containing protein [Solirubrobacter phytolaccae]|uniref:HD domain-containing protein n=1 Tax=Solirubrobacter phytolaccae TaxID=1404360 RepID=A0A9X3N674_9ACTN|nr:HD domain-containing protein [Solirubrobacter phytolaccae]MDA0179062.1 HD domain-containing protein [Solirubrobacter phytolaccae]